MIKRFKKRTILSYIINVILIISFFCTYILNDTVAQAVLPEGSLGVKLEINKKQEIDLDAFCFPHYLGKEIRKYKGGSGKTIFHIQDAHCNKFAQDKIEKIVEYLINAYNIDVINLEGGAGAYDLELFTKIRDAGIRQKVSKYFVDTGDINGAEKFAINNPERITLWGVESKELYKKNLQIYRESLKKKPEVEKYISFLSKGLGAAWHQKERVFRVFSFGIYFWYCFGALRFRVYGPYDSYYFFRVIKTGVVRGVFIICLRGGTLSGDNFSGDFYRRS